MEASYRGFLGMGSSNTGSCSVIVKPNKIEAVKADKNTQSICIGTEVTFTVDIPYIDLTDKEYIKWELKNTKPGFSIPGKAMQYSIQTIIPKLLDGTYFKLGDNKNTKKDLSIQFNQLGIYTLSASMGGKPFQTPTLINVVKAHIESWYFCDEAGNKRPKICWGQAFSIYLKVNGWENKEFSLSLWYDNRSGSGNPKERYYKIDVPTLANKKFLANEQGIFKEEITDSQLWVSLQKLVEEHGIGYLRSAYQSMRGTKVNEYARIMFTVSQVDSLCDNNDDYKSDHPLFRQIYPLEENPGESAASIPNTTEYKAQFLDSSKKNPLTDIISYTDQAYISLQRINSPQDMEVKDLELRLWENKTGEDLLQQRASISSSNQIDKEGYIIPHPVDMDRITKTKQKNQSKTLPRFFYLQLFKMKGNEVKEVIYTYPEGYKTGKDNDGEIIILQKEDYIGEDIKSEPSTANIVTTSAKYLHNINQIPQLDKDKKEFDESKLNKQTADQKNKTAQKQNKETIDKSKNYFLQLKVAQDPSQQKSLYNRTGNQVGKTSVGLTSDCGGKYCIIYDNEFGITEK